MAHRRVRKCLVFQLVSGILCLLTSFTFAQGGVPACYFPRGEGDGFGYACDLTANVSACCAIGWACLDNGLCKSGNGKIARGSCTDRSWNSLDCPQYCLTANAVGLNLISCQNVTNNDRDYCCQQSTDCCDTGIGRFRIDTAGKALTTLGSEAITATKPPTASTSSTGSAATTASAGASELPSSPALAPPSDGLSSGVKAGIGIGAASAVIIIVLLAILIWLRLRQTPASREAPEAQGMEKKGQQRYPATNDYKGGGLHEVSGERRPEELQASPQAWELPDDARRHEAA